MAKDNYEKARGWIEGHVDPRDYATLEEYLNAISSAFGYNWPYLSTDRDYFIERFGATHMNVPEREVQTIKSLLPGIARDDSRRRDEIFSIKMKRKDRDYERLRAMPPEQRTAYLNSKIPGRLRHAPTLHIQPLIAFIQPRGRAYAIRTKTGRKNLIGEIKITEKSIIYKNLQGKTITLRRHKYKSVQEAVAAISPKTTRGRTLALRL